LGRRLFGPTRASEYLTRRASADPGSKSSALQTIGSQALTGGLARIVYVCTLKRGDGWQTDLSTNEQYVAFATQCLQLAKVAGDNQSRTVLREMAAEWLKLAEAAGETNGGS
jgi:hypothetical protein